MILPLSESMARAGLVGFYVHNLTLLLEEFKFSRVDESIQHALERNQHARNAAGYLFVACLLYCMLHAAWLCCVVTRSHRKPAWPYHATPTWPWPLGTLTADCRGLSARALRGARVAWRVARASPAGWCTRGACVRGAAEKGVAFVVYTLISVVYCTVAAVLVACIEPEAKASPPPRSGAVPCCTSSVVWLYARRAMCVVCQVCVA